MESVEMTLAAGGVSLKVIVWQGATLMDLAQDMIKATGDDMHPESMKTALKLQGYTESNGNVVLVLND